MATVKMAYNIFETFETFMSSSRTHLMNVYDCSLIIWFMNYLSSCPFKNKSWFTNFRSLWSFTNNPSSWTKWEFIKRKGSWTLELSWKSHFDERSWTLIVFCSRIFIDYSWIFMNSSWSSHSGRLNTRDYRSSLYLTVISIYLAKNIMQLRLSCICHKLFI